MALPSFKTRAPGSLILMGEYAVLHGQAALVTTINKYIEITLTPRQDDQLRIDSELGQATTRLKHNIIKAPFTYVLTALAHNTDLPSGADITIVNEFSSQQGLGSSAAVTVALLAAISLWKARPLDLLSLYKKSMDVIKSVQGGGSGADIAASTFGGTLYYRMDPCQISTLPHLPWLSVIYSGQKTTTTEALKRLREQQKENAPFFRSLYLQLGNITERAKKAIMNKDWLIFGKCMNETHSLLCQLGVSTSAIEDIIRALRNQPNIFGAKLSGAGLGDCVIGLGSLEKNFFPRNIQEENLGVKQLDIAIHAPGVSCVE